MPQGTTVINCYRHGRTYGITLSHGATDMAGHMASHYHMVLQTWHATRHHSHKLLQTWHHTITWCYRHDMPQGTTVINGYRHGITLSHGATDMTCHKAPVINGYRHGITLSHGTTDMT